MMMITVMTMLTLTEITYVYSSSYETVYYKLQLYHDTDRSVKITIIHTGLKEEL